MNISFPHLPRKHTTPFILLGQASSHIDNHQLRDHDKHSSPFVSLIVPLDNARNMASSRNHWRTWETSLCKVLVGPPLIISPPVTFFSPMVTSWSVWLLISSPAWLCAVAVGPPWVGLSELVIFFSASATLEIVGPSSLTVADVPFVALLVFSDLLGSSELVGWPLREPLEVLGRRLVLLPYGPY